MPGFLRLTIDTDEDGTGELWVEASAAGFSGVSSAHFDLAQIRVFARSLAAFPLPADGVRIEGGFWSGDGGLEQCHVSLWARAVDRRGSPSIRVSLATPVWQGDAPALPSAVALEVATDYRFLERFSRSVERLLDGFSNEAVLEHS